MKLDFVCIGAQKAGTTTLHDILKTHPKIYLPPKKEAQFFDINERYEKGLDFYFTSFFDTYEGEPLIGNVNPNLQIDNRSIDRLIDCFGTDIKVIFMLRDPVDRAYSHYLMSKRRGIEKLPFLEAIKKESFRIANPNKHPNYFSKELGHFEKNHLGYLFRSHYLKTIKYLFAKLPSERIKFYLFEDFVENRKKAIQEVLLFLDIPLVPELQYET
ncbi:MAG TPA: sulfotransferase domain-containing protein, partial [Flavobacteriaceae bacterium]|nr:sulfotransferase domain-containing protein [Flavobacteriaceae bacterium]